MQFLFKRKKIFQKKSEPVSFSFLKVSKNEYIIVTANKIPVPDPIAPIKSARIVKDPIHIPPKVAATGIYLFNFYSIDSGLYPMMTIS